MDSVPISYAQATLSNLIDQVERSHKRVMLTRNGEQAAVVLHPADLRSLEESLNLLSDATAMHRIREGELELIGGQGLDASQLAELLEKHHR